MATAFHGKASRLVLAATVGVAALVLARVAIFIATSPNSVLTFSSDLWQLPVAFGVGFIAFALCYRSGRGATPLTSTVSLFVLSFGIALHWVVFNVPLAQQYLPGIWVK